MTWYVVQANPSKEGFANDWLIRKGYQTLWPHYITEARHSRKVKTVVRSYFPGYLFCMINETQSAYEVNNTPGVSTILCAGTELLSLPENIMESIRSGCDENGRTDAPEESNGMVVFKSGDNVVVNTGPLLNQTGIVMVDNGTTAKVKLTHNFTVTVPSAALHPYSGTILEALSFPG